LGGDEGEEISVCSSSALDEGVILSERRHADSARSADRKGDGYRQQDQFFARVAYYQVSTEHRYSIPRISGVFSRAATLRAKRGHCRSSARPSSVDPHNNLCNNISSLQHPSSFTRLVMIPLCTLPSSTTWFVFFSSNYHLILHYTISSNSPTTHEISPAVLLFSISHTYIRDVHESPLHPPTRLQ